MFKKNTLLRVPVRLGEDTFDDKIIHPKTIEKLCDAMTAFVCIMRINEVIHYKVCATSALREAENSDRVIEEVAEKTGVRIRLLSGLEEANTIGLSQSVYAEKLKSHCVFIDVGGGSTEIVFYVDGKQQAARSFQIGTVRILKDKVQKSEWKEMKEWVKQQAENHHKWVLVGSGGNINRLYKMADLKSAEPLSLESLKDLVEKLTKLSVDERIEQFDLNPDRADVIVPAGGIFLTIMLWLDAEEIRVPKIGLSDGLVRQVYREYREHHH